MRRLSACLLAGLVLLSSCDTWEIDEQDFRAITAWEKADTEPAAEGYRVEAKVYPTMSRLFFGVFGRGRDELENPGLRVRELLEDLLSEAEGDLLREAACLRYLLWVLNNDPSVFNRITALRGVGAVMAWHGMDPCAEDLYVQALSAEQEQALEQGVRRAHGVIEQMFGRGAAALSSADRATFKQAIETYSAQPLPRRRQQRDALRLFWSLAGFERDAEVAAAAAAALRRCMAFAAVNGLRAALVPDAFRVEDFPDLRLAALRIYRREGGTDAVPFLLRLLTRPGTVHIGRSLDRDENVLLLMVRLCAQLQYELALQRHRAGPRPIELLYEVAVDVQQSPRLRRVALEGLALCLGPNRAPAPLPEGDAWAREWWAKFVTEKRGD